MVIKVYPYLGETRIAIESPEHILQVVEGNIDELPTEAEEYEGIVHASEGELRTIERDKTAKYLSTRPNREKDINGCDYLRYRTHIQTIWKQGDLEYTVRNHLVDDESGILKCFKKIYYSLPVSKKKSLIHAATVGLAQQGILIVGRKRSGKTTLALNLIDKLGASLLEGGTTLISFNNQLIANYLPRPIYVRFNTIAESHYLSLLFENLKRTEAQQPWDLEAIQEIIRTRNFFVDGGLNLSRRVFRQLSGKNTLTTAKIGTIIFPDYSEEGKVKIESISEEEAYRRLLEREFIIDTALGKTQDQDNIEHPGKSIIMPQWLEGLKLKVIHFDGNKDLTTPLLEDLIS